MSREESIERASIVVPTYNRVASLRELLTTLNGQRCEPDCFETIIVDDGSSDDTPSVGGGNYRFQLKYVSQRNQGSAAARNRGAEEASGDVLVFLDDDMSVGPDFVAGILAEHRRHDRVVSMANERPFVPDDATTFHKLQAQDGRTAHVSSEGDWVDYTYCVTNNLAVERDHFSEIGGMLDVAGDGATLWGDIDFGYRAHQLGFRFRVSGEAWCVHRDYNLQDLASASARAEHAMQLVHPLLDRYPEVLADLPMLHDKTVIDWRQDSAVMVLRKVARRLTATPLVLAGLKQTARWLERSPGGSHVPLRPLYRWILGAHHYRGYRHSSQAGG